MPATATATVELLDPELARTSRVLRSRAEDLRSLPSGSTAVDRLLAQTSRRRASELELASWALAARAGLPAEDDEPAAPRLRAA